MHEVCIRVIGCIAEIDRFDPPQLRFVVIPTT
jgi:hypothetical protein